MTDHKLSADSITSGVPLCRWGDIEFPLPFGRTMTPAEERIHGMDEKVLYQFACSLRCMLNVPFLMHLLFWRSNFMLLWLQTGASLKLTILNPKGRIWTMVAGGGASVIYADTVSRTLHFLLI